SSTTSSGLSGTLAGNEGDAEPLPDGSPGVGSSVLAGYDVAKAGDYGTLYVNSLTGAYLFVPNAAAIEALDASESDSDLFTMTVKIGRASGRARTYTVNLAGAVDAQSLGAMPSGSIA